jgi:hypothetical protein
MLLLMIGFGSWCWLWHATPTSSYMVQGEINATRPMACPCSHAGAALCCWSVALTISGVVQANRC